MKKKIIPILTILRYLSITQSSSELLLATQVARTSRTSVLLTTVQVKLGSRIYNLKERGKMGKYEYYV